MASIQAALLLRNKKKRKRNHGFELPSHVATKDIKPFPPYPPNNWGKAAWQDGAKEAPSVAQAEAVISHRQKATEAHRRWIRKNKIRDASLDEDDPEIDGIYRQSGAANVVLYVGLIMIAIGMVITFVGIGDKGFKTLELKLIGPSLIGSGVFFCLLRILFCTCPICCRKCCMRFEKDDFDRASLLDAENMANGHVRQTSKSASKLKNTIPNYISDDDDGSEISDTRGGIANPDPDAHKLEPAGPSHRRESTVSSVPRLPAINSPRRGAELVLSPSNLETERDRFSSLDF